MRTLLLLLATAAAVAQAAESGSHPVATLKERADLYRQVVDAAGATKEFSNEKARITILAPTDEAVKTFLKDMGLTLDDLKKNPRLAKSIVAYHTILGVTAGPKEFFAKGDTVSVSPVDPHYKLTVKQRPNGVFVRDAQGNEAKVGQASLGSGKHTIHTIDRVLYSGSYFKDLAAVIKTYPDLFSTVAAAATKAGMADSLTKQGFVDTVFLPTNEAFKKAKIDLNTTPKETLENVLKYHVVPGARTIPDGFTNGKAVSTLVKGQDLVVTQKEESKKDGVTNLRAFVKDTKGDSAMVIKPNLFVSKAVAHVIDGVLAPKAGSAVSTESAKNTKGRKLLAANGRGRGGSTSDAASYAPTISYDSSEQAIMQAVNGGGSLSATQAATQASLANALVSTRFPEHATYADGVKGSIAALSSGGN